MQMKRKKIRAGPHNEQRAGVAEAGYSTVTAVPLTVTISMLPLPPTVS